MNHKRLLLQMVGLMLATLLLIACNTTKSTPTPTLTPTPAPTPTPTTGKIVGTVINNSTGDPEKALSVTLMSAEPGTDSTELSAIQGKKFIVETDSKGAFTIGNIEPGIYGIMVSRGVTMGGISVNKVLPSSFSSTPLRTPAKYYIVGTQIFGFLLATEDGEAAIAVKAGQVIDLGQVPYLVSR